MKRKSRKEIHGLPFKHYPQAPGTGCMYHSFVALTGDESMLQFSNDNSAYRFLIRVAEAGYLLIPVYCNYFQPAGESFFWKQHFIKCTNEGVQEQRLLVTCADLGIGKSLHMIAVVVNLAGSLVTVLDPQAASPPSYEISDFARSNYAESTVEVLALDSAVLEDYEVVSAKT